MSPLEDSNLSAPCALWPVDLKLTHVDCNPENALVHFQGQYLTVCELDYNILQAEIQNAQKTKVSVEVGEFCLVEDILSGYWFRGRVQNRHSDLFDVFLVDHGNILTVDASHVASASDELFILPPKIVCGFFASLLPLYKHWDSLGGKYFSSLIGSEIKGYIQGFLPHKVLILEAPDINKDILKLSLGKHVDRDTFLLLVEMLTEVPLKQSSEPVPDLGFDNVLLFCGPKISVGKKERVKVTAAVNPGTFYCQLTSMGKDLKEMSDKLSLACESKDKDLTEKTIGNLGLLCSVKGKDERWHRGFVQFLPLNSQVRVLFVDYGFSESVKIENILQLPSDLLSVPIMAFPCALSCLNEEDDTVVKSQLNYLKKGLLGDVVDIQIDSFNAEQNLYSVTLHSAEHDANAVLHEMDPINKPKTNAHCELEEHAPQDNLPLQYITEPTKAHVSENSVFLKEMKEGSIFEGYVEHVLNPTNFWLRTQERNQNFEDMMSKMTEYFSELRLDEGVLVNPIPGVACCAMYEKDMHYYRAVVTDTLENGAEVFFADFGNTEKVPYMLIKTLPPKFAVEPDFALNCSLAHVVPVDDVWTVSATDYFRQAVSDRPLLVHVVHKRKDRYVVDLYEKGNQGRSIAMLMATAKMAEYWKHTLLTFRAGSELAVRCSYIRSPSDFWCQLRSNLSKLDELMEKIQQDYQTHADPWRPNELRCIVKCQDDGKWYRGCVLNAQDGEVYVICVDTGRIVKEKSHNLRAMKAEYLEPEGQAFRCSLYNLIEPAGSSPGVWSTDASNLLKEFVKDKLKNLKCTIYSQLLERNKGLSNVVDLHTPLQSATNLLVEKGFARQLESEQFLPSVYPYSFHYSLFHLSNGSKETVFVTHVCSPWELYFQLDKNEEILDRIEKSVKICSEMHVSDVGQVRLCLAKYFVDGKWYRGLAYPVQSALHLNVFFVDYGNMQVVEKSNVLPIPKHATDLLLVPMLALRCRLSDVPQGEILAEVNIWLEKAILNKMLQATIVGKDEEGTIICDLFDGSLHVNEKVKELIAMQGPKEKTQIKPGFRGVGFVSHVNSVTSFYIQMEEDEQAILKMREELNNTLSKENLENITGQVNTGAVVAGKYDEDGAFYRAAVMDHLSESLMKVEFIDYGNEATVDKKNARILTRTFLTQPRLSIPCSLENSDIFVPDTFAGAVAGKSLAVEFIKQLSLAPVQMDFGYSGFAAAVTTPCEFSVVLEDMLLVMSNVSTVLENLPDDLASLPEAAFIPGACGMVKSETKKKWCRAEIIHVDSLSVVIDLVDYGHCAHIPYACRGNLTRLPEELARLPKVAYPCTLRGIRPARGEQWADDAIVFFQECICQRNLLIYFRQYVSEARWEVDIVAGGVNVAKELVDAGYGTYIDNILGLRLQQESSSGRLRPERSALDRSAILTL
ncbi:tudor domain-containing protein 15 [Megalops cyprinoides]|uniref:tudor domain-containing protein 15 n=1 Tax=Megalops cyprinoides TaxID=118141 RepID=UPI0018647E60|nr:tudor domain-containing protein 15 [Megalops cyprinoides]